MKIDQEEEVEETSEVSDATMMMGQEEEEIAPDTMIDLPGKTIIKREESEMIMIDHLEMDLTEVLIPEELQEY